MILAFAFVFLMAMGVNAHLCIVSPIQRGNLGSANLTNPGDSACFRIEGDCGGEKRGVVKGWAHPGEAVFLTFQKNLDHFNPAAPGNFSIYVGPPDNTDPILLGLVRDDDQPSLTFYSTILQVPSDLTPGPFTLHVRYYPNNPKAPDVFHQCADVDVLKSP